MGQDPLLDFGNADLSLWYGLCPENVDLGLRYVFGLENTDRGLWFELDFENADNGFKSMFRLQNMGSWLLTFDPLLMFLHKFFINDILWSPLRSLNPPHNLFPKFGNGSEQQLTSIGFSNLAKSNKNKPRIETKTKLNQFVSVWLDSIIQLQFLK